MNVRLEYSSEFTAGVHWNDAMLFNNYHIKMYMITNCSDNISQNIAFERLKFYIHSQLNHTVFVNQDQNTAIDLYTLAGIRTAVLPAEPVDQLLGIMLYCKLNAVMEDRLIINEIELSSDLGEHMVYLHNADENLGPFDQSGWWHTADLPSETIKNDSTDKVLSMTRNNTWRELELDWPESETVLDKDNTVVFAEFGKDDSKPI
jgi:hypothetical protein